MTAREVFEIASALIDEVGEDIDSDNEAKAPYIINLLQKELAFYESKELTSNIVTLDDELEISDDSAERIMPYGLAAKFALADKDADYYNEYSAMYRSLIRTIRCDEEEIEDEYNILAGMQ